MSSKKRKAESETKESKQKKIKAIASKVFHEPDESIQPDIATQTWIVANTTGPYMHNVVANSLCPFTNHRIEKIDPSYRLPVDRAAWLCRGRQNKREFASPMSIRFANDDLKFTVGVYGKGRMNVIGAPNENATVFAMIYGALYVQRKTKSLFLLPTNIRTTNILSVVYMNVKLDLKSLHSHVPSSLYVPSSINHVQIKLAKPAVTFLVYPTVCYLFHV